MKMSMPHRGDSIIRPYYHRSTTVIRPSICPLATPADLSATGRDPEVCHG